MSAVTFITKNNIDGMVSAILLKHLQLIDDVRFGDKNSIQNGTLTVDHETIVANLPFAKGAKHAYDYRIVPDLVINRFHTLDTQANSAAALIFRRYHHHFQDNKFKTLVKIANRESQQTLNTIECTHVYENFKYIFEEELMSA